MADTAAPQTSPMTQVIIELAKAAGMTPQEFLFGGVGLIIAPFEKEVADRLFDLMKERFTDTAEIGKPNAQLQADFDRVVHDSV